LGTRVRIEKREEGGIVRIDFFNKDDLRALLEKMVNEGGQAAPTLTEVGVPTPEDVGKEAKPLTEEEKVMAEDVPKVDEDESLYSVSNFSI
jgi:hypothetical protein